MILIFHFKNNKVLFSIEPYLLPPENLSFTSYVDTDPLFQALNDGLTHDEDHIWL